MSHFVMVAFTLSIKKNTPILGLVSTFGSYVYVTKSFMQILAYETLDVLTMASLSCCVRDWIKKDHKS